MIGKTSKCLEPFFTLLEEKLGIDFSHVLVFICQVQGLWQWWAHFVLMDSCTHGLQHISQLFITVASICSSALCVYSKCALQPL